MNVCRSTRETLIKPEFLCKRQTSKNETDGFTVRTEGQGNKPLLIVYFLYEEIYE
jgi:hypothetical protein